MAPGAPTVDDDALVARIRADRAAGADVDLSEVYSRLFGQPLGRLALAHFLALCGVGSRKGPGLSGDDRAYSDGREDAAIELMTLAGFDEASLVVAVMTDQLEGQTHGRTAEQFGGEPEPEFG